MNERNDSYPLPNASPHPMLRDGDLLLRPLCDDDVEALWAAGQAADIGRYTSIAWPFTHDAARCLIVEAQAAWDAGTGARFAIIFDPDTATPLFAGTVSLLHIYPERADAEVGYWLDPRARGRGVARRSVSLLCDWAFASLRLQRLHMLVDLDNAPSHAVALASGFGPRGRELWRHPNDRTKDAECLAYERLAPSGAGAGNDRTAEIGIRC
jgi:RimJ/RimL family protein N-acetyltransferase